MIGKVISAGSFGGTVCYVMKEQSRGLEARGVEPPGVREMVEDFEDQACLNPRLQQNVGHISLRLYLNLKYASGKRCTEGAKSAR